MNENLTEDDIQWLAKVIAMMPALAIPADTLARLQAHQLVAETNGRLQATDRGVIAVVTWNPEK